MSRPNHTPGPWVADLAYGRVLAEGGPVCIALKWPSPLAQPANASLISAAPELLEACKAALRAFEHSNCIDWSDLSRAIAKAEGAA
jgi:uncharacterized phage protein gp47/JayE